ncbi:MAG: hypothetical protein DWQ40_07970, partial [Actinobacteria bacterium]
MKRSTLVRWATFLATVFGVWGVLSIGSGSQSSQLEVGELADRTYEAQRADEVVDVAETERLKQEARDSVQPILEDNPELEQAVQDSVTALFDDLESAVVAEPPPDATAPTLPSSTTTTTDPEATSTTSTVPADPVTIAGVVFIDVDGDGVFSPEADVERPDRGIERVTVTVTSASGEETVMTGPGGAWSYEGPAGDYVVAVDTDDSDIPEG